MIFVIHIMFTLSSFWADRNALINLKSYHSHHPHPYENQHWSLFISLIFALQRKVTLISTTKSAIWGFKIGIFAPDYASYLVSLTICLKCLSLHFFSVTPSLSTTSFQITEQALGKGECFVAPLFPITLRLWVRHKNLGTTFCSSLCLKL